MNPKTLRFYWAASCVCVFVHIVSCTQRSTEYFGTTVPKHPPDELWINNGGEPEYIDPGKCSEGLGGEIVNNIFSGLTEAHPETLQPLPDIASSWEIFDDGTRYVFSLRKTTWSDGVPITADDFVYAWKRVLNPATASKYAAVLYDVKNASAYNQKALWVTGYSIHPNEDFLRKQLEPYFPINNVSFSDTPKGLFIHIDDTAQKQQREKAFSNTLNWFTKHHDPDTHVAYTPDSLLGVKALDPYHLEVVLEHPVPYFLNLTSFYTFKPVPKHVLQKVTAQGLHEDMWTRPEYIVSNGPFVLKEWTFREQMVLEKNPRYWDAAHVALRKIKILEVESYNTTLNLYRTGELDWLGSNSALPSEFMDHLETFKDFKRDPYLSVYFYWINTQAPPMDNVLVRRALSLSIDRTSITTHITRGGQIPTADLVPDGLAGYQGLKRPLFDPAQARTLLEQAGYPQGKGLPQITLIYNTSEGHKQIAEAVQSMWKKHLGIDVRIENQEWKVFLKNLQMHQFQMARMGWVGDYADPNTFLHDLLTSYSGNNHSNWKNKAFDKQIHHANTRSNPNERLAELRKAEQMVMDAQPLIPFYVYTRAYMTKPYVKGITSNYQDHHPLKYMSIDTSFYTQEK